MRGCTSSLTAAFSSTSPASAPRLVWKPPASLAQKPGSPALGRAAGPQPVTLAARVGTAEAADASAAAAATRMSTGSGASATRSPGSVGGNASAGTSAGTPACSVSANSMAGVTNRPSSVVQAAIRRRSANHGLAVPA